MTENEYWATTTITYKVFAKSEQEAWEKIEAYNEDGLGLGIKVMDVENEIDLRIEGGK